MNRSERIAIFVQEIWAWYARHKRELPWRDLTVQDDTERAYQILVSEIMLQQTQVARVKIVFKDFLSKFPKIADLARTSNKEVILAWRGMGYNNRALRLRDCAKAVVENNNTFPTDMKQLQALPGVGHYTAAAIRNFAFNIPTPCLDTNIRRILHRTFVGPEYADGTWQKDDKYLLNIAEQVLDAALTPSDATTRDWHAALMDFGSLVCTKRSPKWDVCPLTKAGIMKAAFKEPKKSIASTSQQRKEPGRYVGSTYIPNRIFRGKVVEQLRDSESGMSLEQIGKNVCIDWNPDDHTEWLRCLCEALKKDNVVTQTRGKWVLAD